MVSDMFREGFYRRTAASVRFATAAAAGTMVPGLL
jgi:hypothetical protein